MNINEKWAQFTQEAERGKLIINKSAAATACRKFATDYKVHAICLDPCLFDQLKKIAMTDNSEETFDISLMLARADNLLRPTPTKQYAQCVDNNGLTRSGLTGQQIQSIGKLH